MATLTELLQQDIDTAVTEKLANMQRSKKRSHRKRIDLGSVIAGTSSLAAAKIYNSIIDDIGTATVDSVKTRLYNLADSMARRFFSRMT